MLVGLHHTVRAACPSARYSHSREWCGGVEGVHDSPVCCIILSLTHHVAHTLSRLHPIAV